MGCGWSYEFFLFGNPGQPSALRFIHNLQHEQLAVPTMAGRSAGLQCSRSWTARGDCSTVLYGEGLLKPQGDALIMGLYLRDFLVRRGGQRSFAEIRSVVETTAQTECLRQVSLLLSEQGILHEGLPGVT